MILLNLKNKTMKFNKSYETETIYDVAIQITNYLVELKYVKDCTDTNDMTEFYTQEAINEILAKKFITN
jgi:hypothetical protein